MATARSCKPDQWVKMNSRWLIVLRRVRPVHQCATEIFRPFGALYRRLAGLSRLSRRSTRRKPPETPTVFGSSSPIIKSCNINYLWWLGDQDSNLNDPRYNPLKCRHNLRCRSLRDRNMPLKGKELWGVQPCRRQSRFGRRCSYLTVAHPVRLQRGQGRFAWSSTTAIRFAPPAKADPSLIR